MKLFKSSLFFIMLLFVVISCSNNQEVLTSEETQVINARYENMWKKGNSELADKLLDTSYIMTSPFFPHGLKGIESLKGFMNNNSISFPDFKLTVDDYYVKGNMIFSYWTISGKNTGPLGELPATGKNIKVSGFAVYKVENGKIREEQTFWNVLDFYQQLGFQIIPPTAESPSLE